MTGRHLLVTMPLARRPIREQSNTGQRSQLVSNPMYLPGKAVLPALAYGRHAPIFTPTLARTTPNRQVHSNQGK